MPKSFFQPKKHAQSVSDILPPKRLKKEAKPKEQEEIEIQQETIVVVQQRRLRAGGVPKWPFVSFFLIAVLAGLIYFGWKVLPRAEIKIYLKKYPSVFNEAIEVSKNFSLNQKYSSSTLIKLPAELFIENRNLSLSFPASGKEKIENKASGKIVVYNSYSSDPQTLVANTRFTTPDNKIFLLKKAIVVPGAKIIEGKIISSSIEVDVVASQAGAEYNIGPVAKFTIPGLKGSPKYEGFYAKSEQSMANGFVGEKAVPTDKDIKDAEIKIKEDLENVLKITILSQLPEEFKVVDGSLKFEIISKKINKETDKENKFSIFAEAKTKLIAFREKDLNNALIAKALFQLPEGDYETAEFNIEYGIPRLDFDKGEMSFPAKGRVAFKRKVDADLLRRQVLGKNGADIKALVFSLPGLDNAQLSFWPKYIGKAPSRIEKIKITIN